MASKPTNAWTKIFRVNMKFRESSRSSELHSRHDNLKVNNFNVWLEIFHIPRIGYMKWDEVSQLILHKIGVFIIFKNIPCLIKLIAFHSNNFCLINVSHWLMVDRWKIKNKAIMSCWATRGIGELKLIWSSISTKEVYSKFASWIQ